MAGLAVVLLALTGCSRAAADGAPAAPGTDEADPSGSVLAVFLGDSFTSGVGTRSGPGYPVPAARCLGWVAASLGQGGTGYLNPGTLAGLATYAGRVADVVALDPDVVVVQGGTNDGTSSPAALEQAARDLFAQLEVALPRASVIVLGPLVPPGADQVEVGAVRDSIARAAFAERVPFVDPLAEGWLDDPSLFADGVHPNDDGYAEMAADLCASLRTTGW